MGKLGRTPSLFVNHWTDEINAMLQSVATAASAWLAPLPEAVMTARAIEIVFELPAAASFAVAASIELVGIGVNSYHLDAKAHNDDERKYKEQKGRVTYRNALVAEGDKAVFCFYGVTGAIVAFTAVYEAIMQRNPLKLLAILFPIASAIGTVTMNRKAALHRRLALATGDTGAIQVQRDEAKPVTGESKKQPEPQPQETVQFPEYALETALYFQRNPMETYETAAQALDCSPRTVSNHMKAAQAAGVAHRNGNGWEVRLDSTTRR